jgi:DNA-binding transcriptional MerR regulator
MTKRVTYQVSEVARLANVSVRALHHYDAIGLLTPSGRSQAGYRLYTAEDLLRLQQILVGRELGLPLEQIRRALDDPDFDPVAALESQLRALTERARRTAGMIRAVEAALAARRAVAGGGRTMKDMTHDEITELFDGFDPTAHEGEVRDRWGGTEAYRESARRMSRYTKAEWESYKAEAHAIMTEAAALFRGGASAADAPALDVAERHRRSIDRWFYDCPAAMHAALADMVEADARFAKSVDAYGGPGFTPWWSEAMRQNARRVG